MHLLSTGGILAALSGRSLFVKTAPAREELIGIWQVCGELTLEFAEAMPAEDYLFRPAGSGEIYNYGGQMQHIAENNVQLFSNYLTPEPPPNITIDHERNKAQIMVNIRRSFEYGSTAIEALTDRKLSETVPFFARPLPRWHVLFIAQDHTTHHCGQAAIYLRANGISPPRWRKW